MQIQSITNTNRVNTSANTGSSMNKYLKSLENKYGVSVQIGMLSADLTTRMAYGDACAVSSNPYKNVLIEGNFAKKIVSDSAVAEKYEAIIKNFSETVLVKNQAFLNKHNWTAGNSSSTAEIWASGIYIDENGEIQEWIHGVITTVVDIRSPFDKDYDYYNPNANNQYKKNMELSEERMKEYNRALTAYSKNSINKVNTNKEKFMNIYPYGSSTENV